jgi:hypothetical protein
MGGMNKLLANLKQLFCAWLRQPFNEMDRRQSANEIQPLFRQRNNGHLSLISD